MAGGAGTSRWWLMVLLALSHVALCTSDDSKDSLNCSTAFPENDIIYVTYSIPKRSGIPPVEIKMYYKMEGETDWHLGKIINSQPELAREKVSTSFREELKLKTLYRVRVLPTWDKNNSSGGYSEECEFCSRIDTLDPVRNITKHSAGPNWFAVTWYDDPASCPKEMKYSIRYHDDSTIPTLHHSWDEVPGFPITLSTGQKFVMIMKGVQPNNTYFVSVTPKAEQDWKYKYGREATGVVRTPLGDEPPMIKQPPEVLNSTNTTLKVLIRTDCTQCFATWQYKELDDSVWLTANSQRLHIYTSMVITGLKPSTVYQVRAVLQTDNGCAPYESDTVPFVLTATLPRRDELIPNHPPRVIKSSNTTLTVSTDSSGEYRGFIAHWQYKAHLQKYWIDATNISAHREMTIGGLLPNTWYEVRFSLQWPTRYKGREGPEVNTTTCPNPLPGVQYMWTEEREPEVLGIEWPRAKEDCVRLYLVRWKQVEDEDEEYPADSYDENKCPYNATLLNTTIYCADYDYAYCFVVRENLAPGTRYLFEVTAMDGEGRCSVPETRKTSTPYKFWGGISVGHWCLIIISIILLCASVPGCIYVKKRLAAHIATGRSVTFRAASCNGTDDNIVNGDMDGSLVQEPTTRILERS